MKGNEIDTIKMTKEELDMRAALARAITELTILYDFKCANNEAYCENGYPDKREWNLFKASYDAESSLLGNILDYLLTVEGDTPEHLKTAFRIGSSEA